MINFFKEQHRKRCGGIDTKLSTVVRLESGMHGEQGGAFYVILFLIV